MHNIDDMKIVVASHNADKLREIQEILGGSASIVSVSEYDNGVAVEETGTTFAENALIKARAAFLASSLPSVGDDSGLCVDALGGAPGLYSARYANCPEGGIARLLRELDGVPKNQRAAHFVCAIAYCAAAEEFVVEARCDGYILCQQCGEGGFGYDPIFYCTELNKSFACATPEEKNTVSHRAKALKKLKDRLLG